MGKTVWTIATYPLDMLSRWSVFFKDGHENLCDSPCSGCNPAECHSHRGGNFFNDWQIQLRTLSQQFNISYVAVYDIVHNTLKFHKVSARWVPKNLTDDHKGQRMKASLNCLMCYAADEHDFLKWIVTDDESWAYHYTPETKQAYMKWKHAASPIKKKFKVKQFAKEVLVTVFWDMHGFIGGLCSTWDTVNAAAYIQTGKVVSCPSWQMPYHECWRCQTSSWQFSPPCYDFCPYENQQIWLGGAPISTIQSRPCTVGFSSVCSHEEIPGRSPLWETCTSAIGCPQMAILQSNGLL